MGFFGRLGNLGKGVWFSKRRTTDTTVLDAELEHDRLNPTPSADAERELARLRSDSKSTASEGDRVQEDEGEPDAPDSGSGPVKKTL